MRAAGAAGPGRGPGGQVGHRRADVLVVGAGPSGLAAAVELRRRRVSDVLVIDREAQAGGTPRTLDHVGFGMRDLHTVLRGPAYARRWARLAARAGAEVRLETDAVDWRGPTTLRTTSPRGVEDIEAAAVVLATGVRERPRTARLVPGDRPAGVMTSGALNRFVTVEGLPVGARAVVVGAENVSYAAVLVLAQAGAKAVALVTEQPADQAYWWLRAAVEARYGAPLVSGARVTGIRGRVRVEAVEVTSLATGRRHEIPCDTVVFSGDWIPDGELARLAGVVMDPGLGGPRADLGQRTSRPGVFAAGNLLHGAEMADVCALCGRHVAASVTAFLRDGRWPAHAAVPVVSEPPVRWVSPGLIDAVPAHGRRAVPHGAFLAQVSEVLRGARLEVAQDGRVLWARRYVRLRPSLAAHVSPAWVGAVDLRGGPVTVRLDA